MGTPERNISLGCKLTMQMTMTQMTLHMPKAMLKKKNLCLKGSLCTDASFPSDFITGRGFLYAGYLQGILLNTSTL